MFRASVTFLPLTRSTTRRVFWADSLKLESVAVISCAISHLTLKPFQPHDRGTSVLEQIRPDDDRPYFRSHRSAHGGVRYGLQWCVQPFGGKSCLHDSRCARLFSRPSGSSLRFFSIISGQ